ncbi:TetR/AcrR family transcriptional regulator [Sphingomonas adhaesiva]|uniref:TetR/AcrR family transcriptional regulator n=1 Tax=Sphingomonas adhaesiva TaxID=28212 RepID=UPI002FF7A9B4
MTTGAVGRMDERQRKTRCALHEALGRLVNRMDYADIGVSLLAQEAGVGRPTFYRHYAGVDALLVDRLREDLDRQREWAARLVASDIPLREAHLAVSRYALELIATQPRLYHALLNGSAGTNAVTLFKDQIARLPTMAPYLAQADRAGSAGLAVGVIAGAVSGFLLAWIESGLTPPPARAAELMVDFLRL